MELIYRKAYEWGVQCLKEVQISEAELDARLLLEHVCKTDRNTLLVHGDRKLSAEEYDSYVNYILLRKKHMPLQYITGIQEFMGLEFEVNEHVLIPRQDTEILVEEVMRYLHDGMRILDMCTGSGCILLSLLYYSNDCQGLGVDISDEALMIAKRNAEQLKSHKPEICAEFIQSDLFAGLDSNEELFEIIVSNPPYIRSGIIESLMPEVREYEPLTALDGSEDGLFFYRKIIDSAKGYLTGGGRLFFEIGHDQGNDVKTMMEAAGYEYVEIVKDYAGLERVVHGSLRK